MTGTRAVWLIARREITTRLRSRAYRLSTLALVVVAFLGVFATQALPSIFDREAIRLGLAPEAVALRDGLASTAALFDERLEFVTLAPDEDAAAAIEEHDLDAVVAAPDRLVFESEADGTVQAIVSRAAYQAALPERAAALGLSVEEAQGLLAPVDVRSQVVAPPEDDAPGGEAFGLASLSAVVLLMALSFYGQWVLVGVIEEKANRVVEILLGTVAPWQLLTGKVLGIMALAVMQIAAAVVALLLAMTATDEITLPEAGFRAITMSVTWLVLGLLLYNFVYAALGSTVTRPEDASNASMPLMVLLLPGYFAGLFYVPANPDTLLTRVLTLFPATAPLTMPGRFITGGASLLEVGVAMVGTVAAIAAVIWLGSRIYTGAILQTQRVGILAAFRRARE